MFNFLKPKRKKGLGQLCDLFILSTHKERHCDKCGIETEGCFKLHFANQTICVCPKEKAVELPKRSKK